MDRTLYKGIPFSASLLDFDEYIINSKENKGKLFSIIKQCGVSNLKIRCDVWRMCLGIFNIDSNWEEKLQQLEKERSNYENLVNKHIKKEQIQELINQKPMLGKNPLGKLLVGKPAPVVTKQEQDDKFLEEEIRKDVERTYQQQEFFRNPEIVRILSKVLFVWSKEVPQISYQQGMNQIGASLIWVYFNAAVDPNSRYRQYDGVVSDLQQKYIRFHSNEHAEADIYSLFYHMMNSGHKEMFRAENESKLDINPNSKNNTPILQRIIKLTDIKFKMVDSEFFKHIKLNQVGMRSFLLRWIRCMHTREFELQDSFLLWDNIFLAYLSQPEHGLVFIDCVVLAMMIYMREVALKKDSSFKILQLFQKYPKVHGKSLLELVNLAWNVKECLDGGGQKEVVKKKQKEEIKIVTQKPTSLNNNSAQLKKVQSKQELSSKTSSNQEKNQSQKIQSPKKIQTQTQKPSNPAPKQHVPQISKPLPPKPKQPTEFTISFSKKEWKDIQLLMKKSVEENTHPQSKELVMRVMSIFAQKEQTEIKKIQDSNSLTGQ